ncbi:SusC/RagA family TonB-linked outer membrane protein [Ferruginibacter sp.]|nr:SusC/RagA family TonB-linked outer membrane protein [Ferruginibacter sp.]
MRKLLRLFFIFPLMLFALTQNLHAQDRTVTGTVTSSDDGTPMPGVTVANNSTGKKVQTNDAGYYSIAAATGQTLQFTFVGYVAQQKSVPATGMINIKLVSTDKELENVIVTGYGQKRNKRELSYQTPVVSGAELAATRRDNFLNSLAGRVPGLTVTSTSGLPGASATIMLRGATSIGGNNQSLFVVDGVPLDNNSLNQEDLIAASNTNAVGFANRNSDYTNRIADINPEDIEQVVILKGPEAAALYGSDGASGAIIITTKKGVSGRARISYDNSFRLDEVYRFPELQTQFSRGTNGIYNPEAYSATYGFRYFGPEYNAATQKFDNLKNFFQKSFSQQHNMAIDAGNKDASYRFSTGYLNSSGVVTNTGYTRMTFRLSAQTKLGEKMNLSSSWAYIISDNDKVPKGAGTYYNNLITYPTDIDASNYQNANGTRKVIKNSTDLAAEFDNPYWDVNKNKSNDKTNRLTGNINFSADPLKWLNLTTIVGVDNYTTEGFYLTHPFSRYGFATKGFLSSYVQTFSNINGIARATFKKTIAKKIVNTLSTSFYIEGNRRNVNSQRGEQFFEPDFISINNTAPLTQAAKLVRTEIRKTRAFANYTLGYNNIAFLTFSGIREGISTLTSKFYNTQPFYNYGSASASFIFSDLEAFKKMNWLSYGKLRASYATTGKGPSVAYRIDPQFSTVTTTGGGFALDVFASNKDLKPEFSRNFEVGGEFQFLKKRLNVDVAYYVINTKDQIVSNRLSYGTGGVLKYINGGELENKGIEIQLKGSPVQSKNFTWDVTVNFDKNRGIVKKMPADLPLYYDSDTWVFGNVRSEVSVGTSIANLVGLVFQRNDAGQLLISPTTGLPINSTTYTNIGDRTPDYKIGLINSFTILQNLSVSFNLDIRKGGDVFNGNEAMMVLTGTSTKTLDRLQPRIIDGVLADGLQNTANPTKNTITIVPYYRNDYYDVAFAEGDFIEKVNWLRMRDITIGYRLPEKIVKRQKIVRSASVFVTGTDLFIITNYSGMDPNVNALNSSNSRGFGGSGIDYGAIPNPRGINFGIKAQF